MSRVIFSEKDILSLSKNRYVLSVSKKTITYTNELGELFINEYLAGKMPIQIFEDAGFDMDIIGYQRIDSSCQRWREAYEKKGIIEAAGIEAAGTADCVIMPKCSMSKPFT